MSMERPVNVSDEVAKETQTFFGGSSRCNLQLTQQVELLLALERWRWIYIAPKKLKTSQVDTLVLISHLRNRSSYYWLSRMEMDLHCTKETQDFTSGYSGPNLPFTQQVELLLALKDGNGSALHQRNLRLCWWFLWSKSLDDATFYAPIDSREVEMDLHCTKETQGFTSGSSGPNLPITQQVKLLLALEEVNGATLCQRNSRLQWWLLWS